MPLAWVCGRIQTGEPGVPRNEYAEPDGTVVLLAGTAFRTTSAGLRSTAGVTVPSRRSSVSALPVQSTSIAST
jgi:hypothetical protein